LSETETPSLNGIEPSDASFVSNPKDLTTPVKWLFPTNYYEGSREMNEKCIEMSQNLFPHHEAMGIVIYVGCDQTNIDGPESREQPFHSQ
jgi:hypothetical protein